MPFPLLHKLGELMKKQHLYKAGCAPTRNHVRQALDEPQHHLIIPDPKYLEPFAAYLKQSMKVAAERNIKIVTSVGIFVDANTTTGSLYNTVDCSFMNVKRFPWVKSFDLMEGHSLCYTYDIERGAAIPASYSVMGRKLLLVGLDSMFKAQAVLPQVGSIRFKGRRQRFQLLLLLVLTFL